MIDRKVAESAKVVILDCVNQLDKSVKEAAEGSPDELASIYRRLVGRVMGQLFTEVLVPIYIAHPDLEPEELRMARSASEPSFIPKETGAKLMSISTSVESALDALRADLVKIVENDSRSLGSALQEPLNSLRDIREFLLRVSPEIEEV